MFVDFTKYTTGVTHCYNIGRNIFCNHTSSTNHSIISNSYSRKNNNTSTKPTILSYMYRHIVLICLLAKFRQNGMSSCSKNHIWAKHGIIANIYMSIINSCKIEIRINTFTKMNMLSTPVCMEWRFNVTVLSNFCKHLFQ